MYYTILENARIVIALLKAHKIRHIVLSPGGSNIPIVSGVQDDPFFLCYSVVDERSAMYMAIGLFLETGERIATVCTSAQATRNYIPGLTEAFYKRVPILAITMSKHPRFLGQEYMQCPIQTSLPVDAVKKSFSLPRIQSIEDRDLCVRVANEAILELTHNSFGPVQLNIEALDSETWVLDKDVELPAVRTIKRYQLHDVLDEGELTGKRIMLLIGEHCRFTIKEKEAIDVFCESHNTMVYTNHLSNYCGKYSLNALPVLVGASNDHFVKDLCPNIVIVIGGITGDYDVLNRLLKLPESSLEVWRVNEDGSVIDTYSKLTRVYQMGIADFCARYSNVNENTHEYYDLWDDSYQQLEVDSVQLPFSNVYAAQQLHSIIPQHSRMHFAILNSLRSWMYFNIDTSIEAYSNVGAFGIDGGMSTMLGQSYATDELCFLVIGDLAFYYDMNSLGNRHIKNNVRILLVNNNGGVEFKINTIHEEIDVSRYISADNHFKTAKSWAEENGFLYLSAQTKDEFSELSSQFVSLSNRPVLFEVFTLPNDEREALKIIRNSCRNRSQEELKTKQSNERKKSFLSKVLGETGVEIVKKLIR